MNVQVVIGDSSVGKTALILAACTERFMSHPVPLHPPTPLPEKLLVMEGIRVMLHDSQLRPGTDPGPWEETVRYQEQIHDVCKACCCTPRPSAALGGQMHCPEHILGHRQQLSHCQQSSSSHH